MCIRDRSKSRESRDKTGNLNYFDRVEQLECIKDMTLFNIDIKKEETISNLLPF